MSTEKFKIFKASAGSGKTFTLVYHYLKYIFKTEDKNAFSRILAVTFTNKAADEMKLRVLSSLHNLGLPEDNKNFEDKYAEKLVEDFGYTIPQIQEKAKDNLHYILHNYGSFSVFTIDKFVHRLIRSFSKEIGINMDFEVEMNVDDVMRNIADELISKVGDDNPALTEFILNMVNDNVEDGKSWKLSSKMAEMANLIVDDEHYEDVDAIKEFSLQQFTALKVELDAIVKPFENKLQEISKDVIQFLEKNELTITDLKGGSRSVGLRYYAFSNEDFFKVDITDTFLKCIENENWFTKTSPHADNDEVNSYLTESGKKLVNFMAENIVRYDSAKTIINNLYFVALLGEMNFVFENIKAENNFLLISEFNRKISDLIMEESVPFIYEKLGERYDHILIDEFQDTSILQWNNFLPLVHNSLAKGFENLVVGDAKQSIYRFRGGKVEQFQALPKVLNPKNIPIIDEISDFFELNGANKNLDTNYRSLKHIVEFNNELYAKMFDGERVSEEIRKVFDGHQQKYHKTDGGYVSLKYEEFDDKEENSEWNLNEILNIINDIKNNENRPYNLSDIAILVKKKRYGKEIAQFLQEKGIEVISNESLLVFSDFNVHLLWGLNQYIVAPKNENAKKEIILAYCRLKGENINEYLDAFLEKGENHRSKVTIDAFFEKINFNPFENEWAEESVYLRNVSWVEQLKLDLSENAYLQKFLDEVYIYEKRYGPTTSGCIDHFKSKKEKLSIQTPDGINAVEIMTVHKSKGLEFPVVILPYMDDVLSKTTESPKSFEDILFLGLNSPIKSAYIKLKTSTLNEDWKEKYEKEKIAEKLDAYNALYVATTRASEELYLLTSKKSKNDTIGTEVVKALIGESASKGFQKEWGAPSEGKKANIQRIKKDDVLPFKANIPVDVSYKSKEDWTHLEQNDYTLSKGKMLHSLLEFTDTIDDLKSTYNRLVKKEIIKEDDSLMELATNIMENSILSHFFKKGNKVMKEQQVLDQKGKNYRIDRLWMDDDSIHVLDFKLGKKSLRHDQYVEQVSNYMSLMKDLEDKEVKGFIAYTDGEVVEITG